MFTNYIYYLHGSLGLTRDVVSIGLALDKVYNHDKQADNAVYMVANSLLQCCDLG